MTDSAHSPADPARRKDAAAPAGDHAMPAVVAQTLGGLSAEGLRQFFARESARFTAQRLDTRAALRAGADAYMGGVPMHWMRDWPLPYPLVITRATDAHLTDLDGFEIDDFCLGDGAAPFGHTPDSVVKAIRKQAERGISFMLPTRKALDAGVALTDFYGDFRWQIALSATDANRNAIKVARAVTKRKKVLVFNGAYHGAVDDIMVRSARGRMKQRRGLVGQVHDLRDGAVAVEFNDLAAVEAALAAGDVAAILTEPVMTQAGVVMPTDGFLAGLRALATRHEAVLIFDESQTHTAARGGFARAAGVTPDVLVIGKGVAGGLPTAIWGVSDDIAGRFAAYDALRAAGHTGMGSSLAGNALQAAALVATVTEVATPKAFAKMDRSAARLVEGLEGLFARFSLPWHMTRIGGRVAFTCAAQPATNGTEAIAAAMPAIERAIHIGLLNRGCLISPYHNAMLVTPVTSKVQIARLLTAFEDVLFALAGATHALAEDAVSVATADPLAATAGETAPIAGETAAATSTLTAGVSADTVDDTVANALSSASADPKGDAVAKDDAAIADTRDLNVTAKAPASATGEDKAVVAPVQLQNTPTAPRRGWWRQDTAGAVKATEQQSVPKPAAVQPAMDVSVAAKTDVVAAPHPVSPAQGTAKPATTGARKGWWRSSASQPVDAAILAAPVAAPDPDSQSAKVMQKQEKIAEKPAIAVTEKAAVKAEPKVEGKPKAAPKANKAAPKVKEQSDARTKVQAKNTAKGQSTPKGKGAADEKADPVAADKPVRVRVAKAGADGVKAVQDAAPVVQAPSDAAAAKAGQPRRGWWKKD